QAALQRESRELRTQWQARRNWTTGLACVAAVLALATAWRARVGLGVRRTTVDVSVPPELPPTELAQRTAEFQRKAAELAELRDAAIQAAEAKSRFLANMSHEIRTPMTAILGFAEFLESEGDLSAAPEQRLDAIRTIRRNGEHLLSIINDILDISRLESGKLRTEVLFVDPLEIVQETVDLMQVRAEGKGLDLSVVA
ncbi:MAG: hypothetical protein KC445_21625, partial [Anaerolineales bacterium]|nr:hypothetical protein [Anaerolineales bacterium]